MSKKTVLIYPKTNYEIISVLPPLGPMYITSFLRSKNIDADFYDFNIEKNWKKKIHQILDDHPDVIGLSSNVSNYSNTLNLAKYIKSIDKQIKICVGGPYPSCVPEKYLDDSSIDYLIKQEGEITYYELLKNYRKDIPGVMVKRNGNYLYGGDRPLIEDLDSLPFPALEDVDIKKYYVIFQKKKPVSNIVTSRGCPFTCTFCFHGVHGYKWRARSPKNIFDEMKWQAEEIGVEELCFWDDNFTLDSDRVKKLLDLINKNDFKITWQIPNGIRVDKVDKKLLTQMKNSGLWSIVLAPETGDPYIINRIQKGFSLQRVKKVIRWCKELKIFTFLYFMMGFPFEKIEHTYNTYNFIKESKPDLVSVHKFYPFPNTSISEEFNLKKEEDLDYRTLKMPKNFERMYTRIIYNFMLNIRNILNILKHVGIRFTINGFWKILSEYIYIHIAHNDYVID